MGSGSVDILNFQDQVNLTPLITIDHVFLCHGDNAYRLIVYMLAGNLIRSKPILLF